ncbi:aminotransferase class I/II-fold pyridoxal phosphate-dependent enzyme [Pectinatus sottacetonis]|uniref:aminotransferase class I/II-fold pyridoxal phosphate-dependent enzyme n=1 Tax=Pectinatus sottacetonis TaxID=1002795 RepID=UPI0018C6FCD6|nr:aminotransferase class I/II-fold pyridoxal phosphate-dependent enzyme [Pectinatus sottacetonis]
MNKWQHKTSDLVNKVPPSGIRKFFDVAAKMDDIITLGIGEPDFVTPWHIRESCVYGLEKGYTSYSTNKGMLPLRQEIANLYKKNYAIEYDPAEEIIVTVGVSEAVDLAMRAVINPGDEVLIPEPCYVSYKSCVILAGGRPVPVPTTIENEFRVTADDLEKYVTNKTKMLLIGYPNNPTGTVLTRDELNGLAEFAQKYDLIVLSDEIYGDLTYGGMKHVCFSTLPGMKDRTIVFNGFSKAYAMTGWRLGYALANPVFIEAMNKIHQYTMLCAPVTAQVAGIEALQNGENSMHKMIHEYDRRRHLIYEGFCRMGLKTFEPKGAFYIFPNIESTGLSSEQFVEELLKREHVAAIPGNAFGESGEGFIRCSYATSIDKIAEALNRIENFLQHL